MKLYEEIRDELAALHVDVLSGWAYAAVRLSNPAGKVAQPTAQVVLSFIARGKASALRMVELLEVLEKEIQ